MTELSLGDKITTEFDGGENYLIYPSDIGKTLQNYIAEVRAKGLREGIQFTLKYLRDRKMIKDN